MNFLEIAQRLRRESGLTSSLLTSPTTVVGQTGKLRGIVDWAAGAYTDIQTVSQDWRWLRSGFTLPTVAATPAYAYTAATDSQTAATITRFARWWPQQPGGISNMTAYLTASGVAAEYYLNYMDWASFRDVWRRGVQTDNPPVAFSIDPQNKIALGPVPNAVYTITGEYQMSAQTLALDADIPEMPADFHMLIVWKALLDYAGEAAAPEAFTRAQVRAGPLMAALKLDQLPQIGFGGALA